MSALYQSVRAFNCLNTVVFFWEKYAIYPLRYKDRRNIM